MIARLLVATLLSWLTIPNAPAAFHFVLNTNDSGPGSLRQTIQDAAAGDRIQFLISKTDPGYSIATGQYTISLTTDQLLINKDLTIETSGNASVIVQRSGAGGTPAFRIFDIPSGTVTFGELMIVGGAPASGGGGAIRNSGTLTLRGCTFFGNTANGSGFAVYGGAVNNGGTLTALNSTFSGNAAIYGGAIYNSGNLTVTHCTIDGNVTNDAGGVGGIWNDGTAHLGNSIVAGSGGSAPNDLHGAFSSDGYNFIGIVNGGTGFGLSTHDRTGTLNFPADPMVRALHDNGGPVLTMIPLPGSPVIDQGTAGGLTVDGIYFPRPIDQPGIANASGGDGSDIGAVEVDLPQAGPNFVVNYSGEHSDGTCGQYDCTLIEALDASNANADLNTITFPNGFSGTITTNKLTPGGLSITNPVQIIGPTARNLVISGNHAARVFNNTSILTVTNVTIADGSSNSIPYGGAVLNRGQLTLSKCTIRDSASCCSGGAIRNESNGGLNLSGCTFSGNQATNGGAISSSGSLVAINCTFTTNIAAVGCAIENADAGSAQLTNCTVVNNDTQAFISDRGGALRNAGTVGFVVGNSLVANNNPRGFNDRDVSGAFSSQGYNVLGVAGTGFTSGVNHDQVGSTSAPLDARIDPAGLKNNGGPTDSVALLSTSPAIDAGNDARAPQQDQRGFWRMGASDVGAFEFGGTFYPSMLANISTRLLVQTGDNVLIGGLIITGTQSKKVILRAIGPSLSLPGKLSDPTLELYLGNTLVDSNDNWMDNPNKQAIIDSTIPPSDPLESAIVRNLPPGTYTAIVRGAGNATGIGVIEAYDLDRTVDSKLANISTRGAVQTGDNVLFAGFIVLGSNSQKVIIRALGPSTGVPGALADPTLELHDGNGATLESNDNWMDSANKQAIIDSTIPPSNNAESAIVRTLTPANYTAIVRGVNNTTGIAVVEVYALN
jgi:predicted outer membrane repeat protein